MLTTAFLILQICLLVIVWGIGFFLMAFITLIYLTRVEMPDRLLAGIPCLAFLAFTICLIKYLLYA